MKSVHQDSFTLLEGKGCLGLYQWNKNIAEHFFCQECGVYTHHKRKRYPDQISVNFACLDDLDLPEEKNILLVDNSIEISNLSFTPRDLIDTHNLMTIIMNR